jgi:hypothetical protein
MSKTKAVAAVTSTPVPIHEGPAGTSTVDPRYRVATGDPDLMTEREVAEMLRVTPRVVANLRWYGGKQTQGKLGWIKIGKKVLYERSEVLRWQREQPTRTRVSA